MSEFTESDYDAWENDLELLSDTFCKIFESEKARYTVDQNGQRLVIEIEGLEEIPEEEINEAAADVLNELDLDFDEVILLPMA